MTSASTDSSVHYRILTLLKQYDNRLCADCREVLAVQHYGQEHKDRFQSDGIYASLSYGVRIMRCVVDVLV